MKLSIFGLLISSTLCGCAIFEDENTNDVSNENLQSPYMSIITSPSDASPPLESSLMFQQQFQNRFAKTHPTEYTTEMGQFYLTDSQHSNGLQQPSPPISGARLNINHYARGLMQDLVANLQYVNSTTPLAVVSFVMLDSDYNQSNLLGKQIAESLIHEIHKFGIPVVDFKTTGFIRITEQGDFAFTKDYEELTSDLAARYIVGGTLVKHKDGYLVNARVVGLQSKAVVASAQSFIPNNIAYALISDNAMIDSNETIMTTDLSYLEQSDQRP
ncbi:FlgO family outer membrane protein [uncultured Paraglaciecola sp.]|uniref:FlgO family outer membrane protein n=1 Tax=uncultured Paraglaciecola sp. TaxID=1765024 RepID=UPI0025EBC1A0|nr:FlgO family outer membrane protein [uncultured Paraglaciecola sp.]